MEALLNWLHFTTRKIAAFGAFGLYGTKGIHHGDHGGKAQA
jgi:hypothetical protein